MIINVLKSGLTLYCLGTLAVFGYSSVLDTSYQHRHASPAPVDRASHIESLYPVPRQNTFDQLLAMLDGNGFIPAEKIMPIREAYAREHHINVVALMPLPVRPR